MEQAPKSIKLLQIREKLKSIEFNRGADATDREFVPCSSVAGGIPRGVLCEVSGNARTEWIVQLMVQNPLLKTFWAEEKLSLLPTALYQRGVNLNQVLIAETGDKLFQAIRKAMKSGVFECFVLPGVITEIKMLKALPLFAREANACVFFLSKSPKNAWAIPFQLEVTWKAKDKSFATSIVKTKFTNPLEA